MIVGEIGNTEADLRQVTTADDARRQFILARLGQT